MKTYRNKSLTMKVLLGLVVASCFLPQAAAQPHQAQVNQTTQFVTCVNMVIKSGGSVDMVAQSCIPLLGQCYFTNTMSEESAQPACTKKGIRLPRVILSCAIPGGNQALRFRPSFTLCTTGGVINHIETGEDQSEIIDEDHPMANADLSATSQNAVVPFVLDTNQHRVCTDCHDQLGVASTVVPNLSANLFRPIPPEVVDGTLSSDDPNVAKPAIQTSLKDICKAINTAPPFFGQAQAKALCQALLNVGDNF